MGFELSQEQKKRIEECWKTLLERKDGLEAGMLMFSKLFELQPNLQSYFKFELNGQSLELKLHVRAVIAALDKGVKHLDDWNSIEENFEQLGHMHSMLNVSKGQLEVLADCFEWMMEKSLDEYFNAERRAACRVFIEHVSQAMGKSVLQSHS